MSRVLFPRGVCTTTSIRPRASIPSVMKRRSPSASGSSIVTAKESRSACSACAKLTLCFRRLAAALAGSNSMSIDVLCILYTYCQFEPVVSISRWLTRGERKWAKPACGRRLDGRVRPRVRGKPLRCCARPDQSRKLHSSSRGSAGADQAHHCLCHRPPEPRDRKRRLGYVSRP